MRSKGYPEPYRYMATGQRKAHCGEWSRNLRVAKAPPWPRKTTEIMAGADNAGTGDTDDESAGPQLEGYIVATSRRRGTRCLHKIGLCYRRPNVHYSIFKSCGMKAPPSTEYDMVRRDCWRQTPRLGGTFASGWGSDTGSSRRTSSTSSSSTEESGP